MKQIKTSTAFIKAFNKKFGRGAELVILRSDNRVILMEGSCTLIKIAGESFEVPIFDYWNEDYKETTYTMHVLNIVGEWLSSVGWWSEAENAGSLQFLID